MAGPDALMVGQDLHLSRLLFFLDSADPRPKGTGISNNQKPYFWRFHRKPKFCIFCFYSQIFLTEIFFIELILVPWVTD